MTLIFLYTVCINIILINNVASFFSNHSFFVLTLIELYISKFVGFLVIDFSGIHSMIAICIL